MEIVRGGGESGAAYPPCALKDSHLYPDILRLDGLLTPAVGEREL